jgi:hypothetical protein
MTERKPDELDARLARLSRDIEPVRELWPAIAAAIAEQAPNAQRNARGNRWFNAKESSHGRAWAIAASVLLMLASSAATYVVTQRSMQAEVIRAQQAALQPRPATMPASFGGQTQLGAKYSRARAALDAQFTVALQELPPPERARLVRTLTDLRRAANELSAMLAEHPSDPLLQELLLSTYQNELGLLARVNDLGMTTSLGADL